MQLPHDGLDFPVSRDEETCQGLEMGSRQLVHIRVGSADTLRHVSSAFVFLPQQSDMLVWEGGAGIIDAGAGCGRGKPMWLSGSGAHAEV